MTRAAVWHFTLHYLEMAVAMLLGMAALGLFTALVDLSEDIAFELVEMAVWMTVPMVAWMRHRGHGWRPCAEMTAAMVVPTIGSLVLHWTGAVTDEDWLLMLEHTVMFPAMLVPMLLRRDEYTGHAHDPHTGATESVVGAEGLEPPTPAV